MKIATVALFLLIIFSNFFYSLSSTLKLVHILFRHGERTIDARTRYPKDPYINETYHPYGLGQLTKVRKNAFKFDKKLLLQEGKRQMYLFGKILRKQYDDFLGAHYFPHVIEGVAPDVTRCQASLQLAFAGLYPPSKSEMIDPSLLWQPIPFTVLPLHEDLLFLPSLICSNFNKTLNNYMSSPEFQASFQSDLKILEYIAENTGLTIEHYFTAIRLQSVLEGEEEWGLTLPEWTKRIYPEILSNLTVKSYKLVTATPDLKQIMSGSLLEKIIKDSKAKIRGHHTRIILYSGHDMTVGTLLSSLDVYEPHLVKYGSHAVFELHMINGTYGFKIYYKNGLHTHSDKDLVKLPNCEEFCSIEKFERLTKPLMPKPGLCSNNAIADSNRGKFAVFVSLFVYLIIF